MLLHTTTKLDSEIKSDAGISLTILSPLLAWYKPYYRIQAALKQSMLKRSCEKPDDPQNQENTRLEVQSGHELSRHEGSVKKLASSSNIEQSYWSREAKDMSGVPTKMKNYSREFSGRPWDSSVTFREHASDVLARRDTPGSDEPPQNQSLQPAEIFVDCMEPQDHKNGEKG